MEILAEITHDENQEIQMLIEKKNALKNLIDLLQSKREKKNILYNVEKEYQDTCCLYDSWWSEVIEKYQFQKYELTKLIVDCEKRKIYYSSENTKKITRKR